MTDSIQLSQVSKQYKDTTVVSLESLKVRKGEIYGFLGPNGAGKTTTMKMILSLIEPTTGKIEVLGRDITKNPHYLTAIGSMIEEPSYYPNLTGYENLAVFQKMVGFDKTNISKTLELVGLSQEKNRKKLVKDYSLGMKQRLALAFALVKQPEILLLDEPTNGLDPAGIHEIRELIISLSRQQGLTIFISSHILSEIEQMADRVGIINHGQLVYEGELEKIKGNRWIELGGRFDTSLLGKIDFPALGTTVLEMTSTTLKLADMSDETLSNIIAYLVQCGIPLYRVERKKETLESIFLELTKEG